MFPMLVRDVLLTLAAHMRDVTHVDHRAAHALYR
jgi:hypothetical protein